MIVVLDFGGQYCHLIARRIRQLGVYAIVMPCETSAQNIREAGKVRGIIFSGGPSSIYDPHAPRCDPKLFDLHLPILGLCYGHQLMASLCGGTVVKGTHREYGRAELTLAGESKLFASVPSPTLVWMNHGDTVTKAPPLFSVLGSTEDCPVAAMGDLEHHWYGLQFHPEVTHTEHGMQMLTHFVFAICHAKKSWDMAHILDEKLQEIRAQVGNKNIFLLVSGGIDSTVCFALLNKALEPTHVYGLHIDNGLLRKDECALVKASFYEHGFTNFHVVDASHTFLERLRNVYDPEDKRAIIGETFIAVYQQELAKLHLNVEDWLLGQGTIYPDTIETKGSAQADLIKTHHNRVALVREMIKKGHVIEPLKELYKDEVRELGLQLGLPDKLVYRHPFPGPGLAVRCLCARASDTIVNAPEVTQRINKLSMPFGLKAVILPLRSVGIQGDARSYKHPVALVGKFPGWDILEQLSTQMTNSVPEINRVVYTVHWSCSSSLLDHPTIKQSDLSHERIKLLQDIDEVTMQHLHDNGLYDKIWQMPTVLIPLSFAGKECVVLRPVESREAMTARFYHMDWKILMPLAERLLQQYPLDVLFYDVTNKPPGTIEWE